MFGTNLMDRRSRTERINDEAWEHLRAFVDSARHTGRRTADLAGGAGGAMTSAVSTVGGVADEATRRAGLAKSPGGFTGEVAQYAFWYGYGVRPLRALGPDIGVVIFRMESEDKAKD